MKIKDVGPIGHAKMYAKESDLLGAWINKKTLVKTHALNVHQMKEPTNIFLSFATQSNQQLKSSSNLKQLNKGTHERPCWCVKIGGMFGVLSQTQLYDWISWMVNVQMWVVKLWTYAIWNE